MTKMYQTVGLAFLTLSLGCSTTPTPTTSVSGKGATRTFASAGSPRYLAEDCDVHVDRMAYTKGGFIDTWSWGDYGPLMSTALKNDGGTNFGYSSEEYGFNLTVQIEGTSHARVTMQAPGINFDKDVLLPPAQADGTITFRIAQESLDTSTKEGRRYELFCDLGLNDIVNNIKDKDERAMDEMGPPANWPDASAPSIRDLPENTVLVLNRDLDIIPGTDKMATFIVEEQNRPLTLTQFDGIKFQYRFAFAEFYNSNNLYLYPTHYTKGMRLVVTHVERQVQDGGGREYTLRFKTIPAQSSAGPMDPITWMRVDGRRSGRSDMKIPEFVKMMSPTFTVLLPGQQH